VQFSGANLAVMADPLARNASWPTCSTTPYATVPAPITVTLTQENHKASITVADHGPGIPAAQRERIFEPFTRLESSRNSKTGGAGWAWPSCAKFAAAMVGK